MAHRCNQVQQGEELSEDYSRFSAEHDDVKFREGCIKALRYYKSKARPSVQDTVNALQAISYLYGVIPGMADAVDGGDLSMMPSYILELTPDAVNMRQSLMTRLAQYVVDGSNFSRFAQIDYSRFIPLVFQGLGPADLYFLVTYAVKHGGLASTIERVPANCIHYVLNALTDLHGSITIDMAGWTPAQVLKLGSGVLYDKCAIITQLTIKHCMWFPNATLAPRDHVWSEMTRSVMGFIIELPRLVSLTFHDCNLDAIRSTTPPKSTLDKSEKPFTRLEELFFNFSEHNPRRNRPWGEMRKLLDWMSPLSSLKVLKLMPAQSAAESFCIALGNTFAKLTTLTRLHITCPEKNSVVRPSSTRCEATEFGIQVSRLSSLHSLTMLNATPQALVGWSAMTMLTELQIGIAPVQSSQLLGCFRDSNALSRMTLILKTPRVHRRPVHLRNPEGIRLSRSVGGTGHFLGAPNSIHNDTYGNRVPQCGWCTSRDAFMRLLPELTMLTALRTEVETRGRGRCCRFHLDQLTCLTALHELRFEATCTKVQVCNEDDRFTVPVISSLQHLHISVPVKPNSGTMRELLRLSSATYLSLTCSFGYGDIIMTELAEAVNEKSPRSRPRKRPPILSDLRTLQLKDIRQEVEDTYGITLPGVGTGQLSWLLRGCGSLRSLYLPHSKGEGSEMNRIFSCLKKLSYLTSLHNITTACEDIAAEGLVLPSSLVRLTLNCGGGTNEFVAQELGKCTGLRFFKVRFIEKADPKCFETICGAIGEMTELRELSWVGRYVSNNCDRMWNKSQALLEVMGDALRKLGQCSVLHTLHLYKFPLLKPGHGFSEGLATLKSLDTLTLKRCSTSHAMYSSLGRALSRSPLRVKHLYLGRIVDAVVQPDKVSKLLDGFPQLFEVDYSLVTSGRPLVFTHHSGAGVFRVSDKKRIVTMMSRLLKRLFVERGVHAYNAGRGTLNFMYTMDDEEPQDAFDEELDAHLNDRAEIDILAETREWLQPDEVEAACRAIENWKPEYS